jgi:hypothetical protein
VAKLFRALLAQKNSQNFHRKIRQKIRLSTWQHIYRYISDTWVLLLISNQLPKSGSLVYDQQQSLKEKEGRVRFQNSMAAHSPAPLPPSFKGTRHSKPKFLNSTSLPSNPPLVVSLPYHNRQRKALRISASVSVSNPEVRTGPGDLVASILSKVCPFPSSLISL